MIIDLLIKKEGYEVLCDECDSECDEVFKLDETSSVYQCPKCKTIMVVEMSNDLKIKCKMCRWLHKRDCNSCTEHFARTDEMGMFEKIMWWIR